MPEVEEMGKTSTMKKLEAVVEKVRKTVEVVERLRGVLGVRKGGSVVQAMANSNSGVVDQVEGVGYGEVEDDDNGEAWNG